MIPTPALPPFLIPGTRMAVRSLAQHREERWWYSAGATSGVDDFVRASVGRRWPLYALAARWQRATRSATGADWSEPIARLLAKHALPAHDVLAQIGTPGHYRKHVAVLLDARGERVGVLKCSHAPASCGSIRAESAALGAMHGHLPGLVPRALGIEEAGDHVISLQTPVHGERCGPWSADHGAFCAAVFVQPSPAGCARDWNEALEPRERIRTRLAEAGANGPAQACARLFERVASAADQRLPLGWSHRDFVPSNVWRSGDALAVIDWEWADPSWTPGIDVIHFHLMPALRRGQSPTAAARQLCASGSPLEATCRALGINADPWTLIACYLYDLILFYADANGEGLASAGRHPLIAAACALAADVPSPRSPPARAALSASAVHTLGE
ncbi:MAG: aminoglycoside phosphotransferase family protein [Planctomycetes bacterium]|nr:aminoglycoside phosphotransferase family protein [Planctomycetota bacterium]